MKIFFTLTLTLLFLSAFSVFARVELFNDVKPAINESEVKMSFDRTKSKNCEEMGLVHSRNFTGFQTKKGMFKRMKKQVAKVGGNLIIIQDTRQGQWTNLQQGDGLVFYCPRKQ